MMEGGGIGNSYWNLDTLPKPSDMGWTNVAYQVQAGAYGNVATATATGSTGQTVTASDANYHFGTTPSLFVRKLINGNNGGAPLSRPLNRPSFEKKSRPRCNWATGEQCLLARTC